MSDVRRLASVLFALVVSHAVHASSGEYVPSVDGVLQVDRNWFEAGAAAMADDSRLRRAELNFRLKKDQGPEFVVGYDPRTERWLDVNAKFKTGIGAQVRIGQFKQAMNFEELISTKSIDFISRSLPNAFAIGRRLGIDYMRFGANWTASAGVYDRELTNNGGKGTGFTLRGTHAPVHELEQTLHFGVAVLSQELFNDTARFSARPEADLANIRLVDTGNIAHAKRNNQIGLEAAYSNGPWALQAEYIRADVTRDAGFADYSADGYYVYGTWFVTGEFKTYKQGMFSYPVPNDPGKGALELGLRYSAINLDDGTILGGEEQNVTLGANWYWRSNFKIAIDYTIVNSEKAGVSDDPNVLNARFQFMF